MQYDLEKISRCFALEGNFVFAQSYGEGHINDTYLKTLVQCWMYMNMYYHLLYPHYTISDHPVH